MGELRAQSDRLLPVLMSAMASLGGQVASGGSNLRGAAAAGVCTGLRAMVSMLARESLFRIPTHQVCQVLVLLGELMPVRGGPSTRGGKWMAMVGPGEGGGVFVAVCSMLTAICRHRHKVRPPMKNVSSA